VASDLFIADLHLSEGRPAANESFFRFIEDKASTASSLYILGDLFEYWIGDDDLVQPFHSLIAGFLLRLSRNGVRIFIMHGNRDFLMTSRFCEATGATLLSDPATVLAGGVETLLMHGDTLCQGDTDYQAWRRVVRSDDWQRDFLSKPLSERRSHVLALRERSRKAISQKAAAIMDVTDAAVRDAFEEHGVERLVHGHTHRPGHHVLEVAGRRCERWVLPDWYGPGGFLEISGHAAANLVRFS
jgi:UDP-2,3-diacylglucosamine hydrolase